MKEWMLRKPTEDTGAGIYDPTTGQLLYRLELQKESPWAKSYAVTDQDGQPVGTLQYKHEAFRLAHMPKIFGYLGETEVFCVKREIEALEDAIVAEGEGLGTKGPILSGEFQLYSGGQAIAAFHKAEGGLQVSVAGQEPLAALFALALECF